jgi:cell division septum initiation protein DivIVA
MGKTKEVKAPGLTLEQFFEQAITQAKISAAASDEVGKFLMAIVAEIGGLTKNISEQITDTLDELEKEMAGKTPAEATSKANHLMGRATAFGYVADQMTAMVDRLKEVSDETVH